MATAFHLRRCGVLVAVALTATVPGCAWMRTALQFKDNVHRSLADRARDARADGNDDEAVRLLDEATRNQPTAHALHRDLAEIHAEHGRIDEAVEHLQRVVELVPEDAEAWGRMATLLHESGDTSRAAAAANRALQIDPQRADALLVRATVLEHDDRSTEALDVCHRLLEADPGNVDARLAVARMHMRNGDPNRAAPVLRSLCSCPLADDHEKAEAWWALGIAYGRVGRWTDAVRALETGADERGATPDDLYRLAFAQRAAGDLSKARATLDELIRQQPNHPYAPRLAIALRDNTVIPTAALDVPPPAGW